MGVWLAVTRNLPFHSDCAGWDDQLPYDWMRCSQPSSPVAGSQEQNFSAVSAPANTDTVMQPIQALADDALINSQPADSTTQNASDQGIAADEGASATEGASAHVAQFYMQRHPLLKAYMHMKAYLLTNAHLELKKHPYAPSIPGQKQSSQHHHRQEHTRQTQRNQAPMQQALPKTLLQTQHHRCPLSLRLRKQHQNETQVQRRWLPQRTVLQQRHSSHHQRHLMQQTRQGPQGRALQTAMTHGTPIQRPLKCRLGRSENQ